MHPEQGGLYVETPTGRRLRPNTTARIERHLLSRKPIEIRTNSLGYRNREIGPKIGTRILFLGDSITFADYLEEGESFVRLVEILGRGRGRDWETINAGVGGVSLATELAILVETGLSVEPDVVVLGWYLNDFLDSPGVDVRSLPALARRSRLAYLIAAVARVDRGTPVSASAVARWHGAWREREMERLMGGDPARREFFRLVDRHFEDWGGAWSSAAWNETIVLLEEFAALAREHGFAPAIVAFPVAPQVAAPFDTGQPQARLAQTAESVGVPFLDLLPTLREASKLSTVPLFYDQCHHTPRASRIVAEHVEAWLAESVVP